MISCTLGSDAAKTAIGEILFVDVSKITVTSISPNVTEIKTSATVVFTGTGFVNSSELACVYGNLKYALTFSATFLSSTSISCFVPAISRSVALNLYLSFVAYERQKQLVNELSKKFYISIDVPTVIKAGFDQRLGAVNILFTNRAALKLENTKCKDLFPSNYTTFGSRAKCKFVGDRILKIILIGRPTLQPGIIEISLANIKSKGAMHTVYKNESQSFTVSGPPVALKPKFELGGPLIVGMWLLL